MFKLKNFGFNPNTLDFVLSSFTKKRKNFDILHPRENPAGNTFALREILLQKISSEDHTSYKTPTNSYED